MDQAMRTSSLQPADSDAMTNAPSAAGAPEFAAKVVMLAPGSGAPRTTEPNAAGKWPVVLERVRGAAHYIRAVEDRAQEYEVRVQDLLQQVRADMAEADAKVRAAEQRTREVQTQAAALIRAAEDRARASDERAASAEEWLRRISEAIESEFVIEPALLPKTGTLGA